MELSERAIQTLESEGFINVYEHQDAAGTEYPEHSHQGKVSVFVTDGSITFDFSGEKKEITAPRRFNIPPSTPHSAKVGPAGCILIIAEEIDGDS
jgi:quercetin dioxygenase-like cupin family protein